MDIDRHLRVLWRHRGITAVGLVLAVVLAFLAAFRIGGDGVHRRGQETWSSTSLVLVTQQGFPWGRVTLPAGSIPALPPGGSGATATPTPSGSNGGRHGIEFADPSRFSTLALLYSVISYSDEVRGRLPEQPTADQIHAVPLNPTNNNNSALPIISLTTTARSASGALTLNHHTVDGLRSLLVSQQQANAIPAPQRVELNVLNEPGKPTLVRGRSITASVLAVLLVLVLTLAVAHVREALRLARERRAAGDGPESGDDHGGPGDTNGVPQSPVAVPAGAVTSP